MSSPKSSFPNPEDLKALPQSFYRRPVDVVAREFIGKGLLVKHGRRWLLAQLTEVEAYSGDDEASHSFKGKTKRNWPMFEPGGTCYVYLIYGMHLCVNVVTGDPGNGEAVLLRAAQPLTGIDRIRELRLGEKAGGKPLADAKLLSGPANLTKGMGITMAHNGLTFWGEKMKVVSLNNTVSSSEICTATRIGITKAADLLRRYCLKDAPSLSRKV